MTQHYVCAYEVISVSPATGLFAVFAEESDGQSGKFVLKKYPIRFIGAAKVTERYFVDGILKSTKAHGSDIVGLQLSNGSFMVCNELSNFAGLMEDGQDINEATDYLIGEYLSNLVQDEVVTQ